MTANFWATKSQHLLLVRKEMTQTRYVSQSGFTQECHGFTLKAFIGATEGPFTFYWFIFRKSFVWKTGRIEAEHRRQSRAKRMARQDERGRARQGNRPP